MSYDALPAPSPSPHGQNDAWTKAADHVAIMITIFLALSFITAITRFRFWHTNFVLRCFLGLAKNPLYQLLGNAVLIVVIEPRELYLVWAVLLFIGFGNFFSIVDYSIYTSNRRKLMQINELMQLSNNFTVLILVLIYGINGHKAFANPLWAIWVLSLIKNFYRMASFYFDDRLYGSADSKLVALHMKREQNVNSFNPTTMQGYKYLLLGEKPAKVGDPPTYEIEVDVDDAITIDDVWNSEGSLLKSGDRSERLKDTCLSFALFKMLNRRFEEECDTAEAGRRETRDFILRGLLTFPTERVFRVIDMEIRFLRELFYTKYPATFGFGFPGVDILLFVSSMVTFYITFSTIYLYKDPDNHIDAKQTKRDVIVTGFILCVVMVMEVWEFIRYFLSDWSKVFLVTKYVKSFSILDRLQIDKLLGVLCSIYLSGHTTKQIGQFSLFDSYRISCGNYIHWATCGIMGYRDGGKKATYVSLKEGNIVETIIDSLKRLPENEWNYRETIPALSCHRGEVPAWTFELHNPVLTIMIWHVATSFCLMVESEQAKKEKIAAKDAATSLSNYCAYLVVHAPELLPISHFSSNLIFEKIVSETRGFFSGCRSERRMLCKMKNVGDNEQTVIRRGAELGKKLKISFKGDEELWNFMKSVWAELLLQLAPSENSIAHAKQLAEGGEFITYLWVLLYHAGVLGKTSTI